MNITEYIKAVDEQFQTGIAREHSYRPALQQLLDGMLPNHTVTNEPAHFDCGAPDYIISQKNGARQPVFFVEAKDLFDSDLDGLRQHKEQFNRYKSSLDYIIFTDYLDFHVYEHGEWTKNVRIGELQGKHIRLVKGSEDEFSAIIQHLADAKPSPITSPMRLAQQMASKARLLADVIGKVFENAENEDDENYHENSQLESQLQAFRSILIHDLTSDGFADIYAQTIAYGMFAARLHDDTPEDFSRQEAAMLIPKTNPFLRQIFQQIAGYDLDSRIAWIVDDLAQTFLVTDVEKVMKTYGDNALHSDPMIHFYEDFLSAYDPKLRKAKGVWYTPQPVVRFIVRAVDEILQRDFNLPMGLADDSKIEHEVINDQWDGKRKTDKTVRKTVHRVQILDPATGTGTFLAEVVRQIYGKFQGMQGMWQGYVDEHLLPRLHGFELLMASYAVAHLKLDMQLRTMGYDFARSRNRRLGIYLTNSLEEYHPDTGTLWSQWLSAEADQANYIKRDCPVMVMVGNPPYSGESQNKGEWIMRLMEDYKKEPGGIQQLNERNPKWINDDYVKFIRLAQSYVERNGQGVIGFINPHGFLDNPTFRGMRWNLLHTFDKIYTIDLHGNSKKKETCPDGSKDENVFDIMQGVSINIFVKTGEKPENELGKLYHKDLYGLREDKYKFLSTHTIEDVGYTEIQPSAPMYLFTPQNEELKDEYNSFVSINRLWKVNSVGVVSANDELNFSFSEHEQKEKIHEFISINEYDWRQKYGKKDSRDWQYRYAMKDALAQKGNIELVSYKPFDNRYSYFTGTTKGLYSFPRMEVMGQLLKENVALIASRQCVDDWRYVFVSNKIANLNLIATAGRLGSGYVFPLYLYTTNHEGKEERIPNFNAEEWQKFNAAVGREVSPEELLHYIYGVLHSPSYRERYKEFLKIDFPRIPLPKDEDEFKRYGGYGAQLIGLHLMRGADTWQQEAQYNVVGSNTIEEVRFEPIMQPVEAANTATDKGNVWINGTQYFGNVPAEAWNAYIGGYQPAQKWLKDRKGHSLTYDDIRHYLRIIHALSETQRIMREIG